MRWTDPVRGAGTGRIWLRRRALLFSILVCTGTAGPAMSQGERTGRIALEVPYVRQEHPRTCLVACGVMVMSFHGESLGHDELWRSVRMYQDGTSSLEIENVARGRGFDTATCAPTEADLISLLRLGLPTILAVRWGGKHALVVRGYDPSTDRFAVMDPARGPQEISRGDLAGRREPYGRQALVIVPRSAAWRDRLRASGLPTDEWEFQARTYRAGEYVIMAESLPAEATVQRLSLFQAAFEEVPWDAGVRSRLAACLEAAGRRGKPIAAAGRGARAVRRKNPVG